MKFHKFQTSRAFTGPAALAMLWGGVVASTITNQAVAGGFLLAPTRMFFEGSARSQELTIMNQSDKVQTYRLRLEDRRLKDSGEYDVITDPSEPATASSMLRLSVRQIIIPPRSSGTVRVLLRKPVGLPSGENRSHLVVQELPVVNPPAPVEGGSSEITVAVTTIFGISIPVIVRTGETSARITKVVATRVPIPDHPELENVVVNVEATGNRSLFADIRLVSTRQRRAEPIAVAKSFGVYAPLGTRSVTLSLDAQQTARLRAGNVVLQYQEVGKDGAPVGNSSEVSF
jgi:P pilus assembly chaperone PapD